jgi:DNA polymerase (family 10)
MHLLSTARQEAELILAALSDCVEVTRASPAGGLRRFNELVGNIDLVIASSDPGAVRKRLRSLPQVKHVSASRNTPLTARLKSGISARLWLVPQELFPFALLQYTGSSDHVAALRARGVQMGLSLSQDGLFRGSEAVACTTEEDIYAALGLSYVPPEMREDTGEIEAAEKGTLPHLVDMDDIRGVLHVHTTWSDGEDSLEAMVRSALERGHQYIGISEHSQFAHYAGGLSVKYPQIRILFGIESDVLADGTLDYEDRVLESFDFVIASVHSYFGMDEQLMTARIIRAIENPYTTILGHPTGRLLQSEAGYAVDLMEVIAAAAANGVAIEISGNPYKLELDWRFAKRAGEKGVMMSINPDAHKAEALSDMLYGVGIARKSWLRPNQILNTRSAEEIVEFSRARRQGVDRTG